MTLHCVPISFLKPFLLTNSKGIIPNWLLQSMDLAEIVQVRINNPIPRRHGARPPIIELADDITRKIEVLTESCVEEIQSKPFLRVYSK